MPPEALAYSTEGGSGSRLMMCRMQGRPIAPEATRSCTRRKAGSKRRLKPTWSLTPAASTAASATSMLGRSSASGFSQKMCLPACAASRTMNQCVSVLVAISTAGMSGSASSSW